MDKSVNKQRILVMAGGTGGHVFPALAMAKQLQDKGYEIHWLGTQAGIEAKLVPAAGIELHTIEVTGLRGKGKLTLLAAPFKLVKALWQARRQVKKVKPVAVLGLGGFATGPGGLAARLMGIPLVIHEQNAIAGMTNKTLAPMANVVMQAFDGALPNALTVGNPVREDIVALPLKEKINTPLNILIVGGSLGAAALNSAVIDAIVANKKNGELKINICHQVGSRNIESVLAQYKDAGIELNGQNSIEVLAFIDDMAQAYQAADLIVCRSGALTVSEVACAGLPAIFVPFPFAVDDHQTKNADVLVQANAAELKAQNELTGEWLLERWQHFSDQPELLLTMAGQAKTVAINNATELAVEQLLLQIEKRTQGEQHD